jgi:hypothetical protein
MRFKEGGLHIMRNLIFFLLIIIAFPSTFQLLAAEPEEQTLFKIVIPDKIILEKLMYNGHVWNDLDLQSKTMYIIGIEEGATLLVDEMSVDVLKKNNTQSTLIALKRIYSTGFRASDIVLEIDKFYEQPINIGIPIVEAYRHVLKKFNGASPDELVQNEAKLRKKYNK